MTSATYLVTSVDGVATALLLFTVAAGLMLIFGTMNVLNLAHGSLYLAGAYLAWALTDGSLLSLALALIVGVALGVACGGLLGALLRPIPAGQHLNRALATLGLAFVAGWGCTQMFGAAPLPADPPDLFTGRVELLGHGYPAYRLGFIAAAALVAAGLHVLIRHTRAGVMLRAVIADPGMAAATGIHTGRVRTGALAVGGALGTVAGVLGAPLLGPAPGIDVLVLSLSLIIVVIGGAGSVVRTLGAALLVGQVQTVGVLIAPVFASFLLFSIVLIVLVARGRTVTRVRSA
jgi:branched-subunit amino acid ABC-type transport system permease component